MYMRMGCGGESVFLCFTSLFRSFSGLWFRYYLNLIDTHATPCSLFNIGLSHDFCHYSSLFMVKSGWCSVKLDFVLGKEFWIFNCRWRVKHFTKVIMRYKTHAVMDCLSSGSLWVNPGILYDNIVLAILLCFTSYLILNCSRVWI